MMKTLLLITFVVISVSCSSIVSAEGNWNVNGFIFSNVNTLQRGNKVVVSGRVSSGAMRSPLQARILVSDDAGKVYQAYATIAHYTGKGETFETSFNFWNRANWWKIVGIEVN